MYNTMGISFEREKGQRITKVPTLCPVLDILSYGDRVYHSDIQISEGYTFIAVRASYVASMGVF